MPATPAAPSTGTSGGEPGTAVLSAPGAELVLRYGAAGTAGTGLLTAADEQRAAADRLVREFSAVHPPGEVLRCVARCWERTSATGDRADLAGHAESLARAMLRHPSSRPARAPVTAPRPPLVLCDPV